MLPLHVPQLGNLMVIFDNDIHLLKISSSNKFIHWLLSSEKKLEKKKKKHCIISVATYWAVLVRNIHPAHKE